MTDFICKGCGGTASRSFVDLGTTPLANAFLSSSQLSSDEASYPLQVRVCEHCLLVQVGSLISREQLFEHYLYFSSYSDSWLEHARRFCEMAIERFALNDQSRVVEIASNDGYLLSNFVRKGIPCLGIEPARNIAEVAVARGVETEVRFFGLDAADDLVARGWQADLIVANNVLAHVPDLNDFLSGVARLVAPEGAISFEFPHFLRFFEETQFDTVYHEHFCYFSLFALEPALAAVGLAAFEVEELATHGGSLRLYVSRRGSAKHVISPSLERLREKERAVGLDRIETYTGFQDRVSAIVSGLQAFLAEAREKGQLVVAYGAAAKGNTLLNVAGVGRDSIPFVVDRSAAKQGMYLPGSRLPVLAVEELEAQRPDFVLILPWNLSEEISTQIKQIRNWTGAFVTAVPELRIWR